MRRRLFCALALLSLGSGCDRERTRSEAGQATSSSTAVAAAQSQGPRRPATTSPGSTRRRARRPWSSRPRPGRAPGDRDIVWLSDFGANALVRFEPATEKFTSYVLPDSPGNVRQILGRAGEIWAPESAADALLLLKT